ncbi:hypothetical protein E4U09_005408 [Claviceps aff. purpurea]|uniref:Uncharacterized protein n=1 Tax=Claviceps aff. purpurea TaxID=1967640 RepID=A0A9P7TWN7_9HYPO|nr:hypothetical protein E4U09_005408 [Claviceps aff. purpurea]
MEGSNAARLVEGAPCMQDPSVVTQDVNAGCERGVDKAARKERLCVLERRGGVEDSSQSASDNGDSGHSLVPRFDAAL